MKRQTVFLFSGQGSQYYQMGRELYEHNPVFRTSMDSMDALVRATLHTSVLATLYGAHAKTDPFDDIRLTHPAIFMVEYALAQAVMALGITPDLTLGASLGTFAALAVAGRVPAEQALAMVLKQAMEIDRHCPQGGMLAVLGAPDVYAQAPFLQARSVIGGRNFSGHLVLSAPAENLTAIESFLRRAEISHQRVPVQYPFHSPWIEPIRELLTDAGKRALIGHSATPVICCAQGGVLGEIADDYFWQVARKPVAFMDTIEQLEQSGTFDYVDFAPSGTLATSLRYLLPKHSQARSFAILSPFGRDGESLASVARQLRPQAPIAAMAASAAMAES